MTYRSKKALEGTVRIVTIEGADTCACCGTHVRLTGSIGQIKALSCQKYKSGVRVSILCGRRALEEETAQQEQLRRAAVALSAKQHETAEAVERVIAERDHLRWQSEQLGLRLFDLMAKAEEAKEARVVACDATLCVRAGSQQRHIEFKQNLVDLKDIVILVHYKILYDDIKFVAM